MAEQPYGNVPLFRDLTAEKMGDLETTEIESLCLDCHEQGTTRLLLTKIPFFREIVIMSFSCPHCGHSNNDVQPAGRIQEKGCRIDVEIITQKDFNRQVVRADTATVQIPQLDFEIPPVPQRGSFTTIEGLISRAVEGLQQEQPIRKALNSEIAAKIDEFIEKLKNLEPPFHVILDDPAGNSFIENPNAPGIDSAMNIKTYERTKDQNKALGLKTVNDVDDEPIEGAEPGDREARGDESSQDTEHSSTNMADEVLEFDVNCSNCSVPIKSRMKIVNIPHFKEVILMACNCEACGFKDTEVKSGSGIEPKGKRITLRMTDAAMDLNRDVLKSDTCKLFIPDLDFELTMGTLGGKFTTLEGLLTNIKDQLLRPFSLMRGGDSAEDNSGNKLKEFIDKIDEIIAGNLLVSIVLDDPAGNCFIQNVYAPEQDPELTVDEYERTDEQNDDLGLLHMKTENYEETS